MGLSDSRRRKAIGVVSRRGERRSRDMSWSVCKVTTFLHMICMHVQHRHRNRVCSHYSVCWLSTRLIVIGYIRVVFHCLCQPTKVPKLVMDLSPLVYTLPFQPFSFRDRKILVSRFCFFDLHLTLSAHHPPLHPCDSHIILVDISTFKRHII